MKAYWGSKTLICIQRTKSFDSCWLLSSVDNRICFFTFQTGKTPQAYPFPDQHTKDTVETIKLEHFWQRHPTHTNTHTHFGETKLQSNARSMQHSGFSTCKNFCWPKMCVCSLSLYRCMLCIIHSQNNNKIPKGIEIWGKKLTHFVSAHNAYTQHHHKIVCTHFSLSLCISTSWKC